MHQDSEMETMTTSAPKKRTHYTEESLPKRQKSDNPTYSQQLLVENWMSEGIENISRDCDLYISLCYYRNTRNQTVTIQYSSSSNSKPRLAHIIIYKSWMSLSEPNINRPHCCECLNSVCTCSIMWHVSSLIVAPLTNCSQ